MNVPRFSVYGGSCARSSHLNGSFKQHVKSCWARVQISCGFGLPQCAFSVLVDCCKEPQFPLKCSWIFVKKGVSFHKGSAASESAGDSFT